jgi:hypothetical protein
MGTGRGGRHAARGRGVVAGLTGGGARARGPAQLLTHDFWQTLSEDQVAELLREQGDAAGEGERTVPRLPRPGPGCCEAGPRLAGTSRGGPEKGPASTPRQGTGLPRDRAAAGRLARTG